MKKEINEIDNKAIIQELYKSFDNAVNKNGKVYSLLIDGKDVSSKSSLLHTIKNYNERNKKYNIAYFDASQNVMFEHPIIPILYCFSKNVKGTGKFSKLAVKFTNQMTKLLGSTNGYNTIFNKKTNVFKEFDEFYNQFDKLQQVIRKIVAKKRFVVLVDHLDICPSDYQYKVLDDLYNVFDNSNTVIALSYDKSKSTSHTREIFDSEVDDEFNLDKFVEEKQEEPEQIFNTDILE